MSKKVQNEAAEASTDNSTKKADAAGNDDTSKKDDTKKSDDSQKADDSPKSDDKAAPSAENMLELHNMTKKERREYKRQAYRETTKDMSSKEKREYFFDYYKWYIIGPICALLLLIYLCNTVYKNTRPLALSYAILNVEDSDAVDTSFFDSYLEYGNFSDDYRFNSSLGMDIDYDYFKEHEEYITTGNSTDYNILSTECEMNDFDIIISNATGIKYCSTGDVVSKLSGYLDSYAYSALEGFMSEFENSSGNMDYFAIDISDTDFAKQLNTGYEDVYIAFPGSKDENKDRALHFLEYILGITLTEE